MKKLLLLCFLLSLTLISTGQSKVELQIQLLTPDVIGEVNFDRDQLFEWVKKINDELEGYLQKEKGDRDVMVQVTLFRDEQANIQIAARPALKTSGQKKLAELLARHPAPKTKFTEYSFLIVAVVNEGGPKGGSFYPTPSTPYDTRIEAFKALSLKEKKAALQNWMKEEIIPIICAYGTQVDPQFAGVLSYSKQLVDKGYEGKEIAVLTEQNPDYWRAVLEMQAGNQLIPFSKICLHIANGEFDRARRLLFLLDFFSEESTLSAVLHPEINTKINLFTEELSKEIEVGIAYHDRDEFQKALDHYEKLLKDFPESAWLNYEVYFSQNANKKNLSQNKENWDEAKKVIYACDQLYSLNVHATSGKEGYKMFRRMMIKQLFQSQENLKKDLVTYADIALDLEEYGFAAQLYWLIANFIPAEVYGDRNMLAHFLYCLDELGDKETAENFKEEIKAEFPKIKQERIDIMKADAMYKAFEKEE